MANELTGSVTWQEGMAFLATASGGQQLLMDASPESGGKGRGPKPLDLVLLGLGGCTAMDVISILRKKRQEVALYEVRLHSTRAETHPQVFEVITIEHVLRGPGLQPSAVERAIELSATKYCPASAMLGRVATIRLNYRVIDDATGDETAGTVNVGGNGHRAAPASIAMS